MTWETGGGGIVFACGSGGAAMFAAIRKNGIDNSETMSFKFPGGTLEYHFDDEGAILMVGPAIKLPGGVF